MDTSFGSIKGEGSDHDYPADLKKLLTLAVEKRASDVHLTAGAPPVARIYGKLVRLDFPRLTPKDIEDLVYPVLDTRQRQE